MRLSELVSSVLGNRIATVSSCEADLRSLAQSGRRLVFSLEKLTARQRPGRKRGLAHRALMVFALSVDTCGRWVMSCV